METIDIIYIHVYMPGVLGCSVPSGSDKVEKLFLLYVNKLYYCVFYINN